MSKNNLDRVMELYHQGFKCIRYEDNQNGGFTVFLKNFEDEKIDCLTSNDVEEIAEIKRFIDDH